MTETLHSPKSSNDPEFSAGAFTISHFSDSPEGFEFATKRSVGRTETIDTGSLLDAAERQAFATLSGIEAVRQAREAMENATDPTEIAQRTAEYDSLHREYMDRMESINGDRILDENQKRALGEAMKREMQFNGVNAVREARDAWKHAANDDTVDMAEVARLKDEFETARQQYMGRGKKIGFRAVELTEGNVLSADVQAVPFPVYNIFASPEMSKYLQEFSAASGVAMILQTSDDRLVIQHRAVEKQKIHESGKVRGNASYVDIPGASVAGMVDASYSWGNGRKPGTPDPVDTDFLRANILKEASEELGLAPTDIDKLRIVGLAQDKIKIHDEVLWLADSHLTAAELREASRLSNRNKNLDDADFEEKFIDIESSPEAIETLLTEVKCPLPPTHAAALVAAGYSLMVRERGTEAAVAWRQRIEGAVRANYEAMNAMTADYYVRFPEALEQVPERFWNKRVPARNVNGYAPAYSPEEQGLPSLEDEMIRTGLQPEHREHVSRGYLFDIDGVITNPQEKRVTDDAMFDEILARLETGEPVCFNTGRSTAWAMDRVIQQIDDRLENKQLLQNMIIVGEKGGAWTTFDADGNPHHDAVESISVPDDLKQAVRELIAEKYSDAMFFDESKETMLSVEMNDGYDIEAYTLRQAEFVRDIQALLEESGMADIYRIDATTIATDVESPYVSKALGADRFMEYLRYRDIVADSFVTFGDSSSDVAMADEIARRNKPVEFVYVGNNVGSLNPRADYPVTHVDGFNNGTLAYLASHR